METKSIQAIALTIKLTITKNILEKTTFHLVSHNFLWGEVFKKIFHLSENKLINLLCNFEVNAVGVGTC